MTGFVSAGLTSEELAFAQAVINDLHSGLYTIREMFGPEYHHIPNKNAHGIRFKRSVELRRLENVELDHEGSNHIHVYRVVNERHPLL